MLQHVFRLLVNPNRGWEAIRDADQSLGRVFLAHTAPFSLLPVVCGYVGTTAVGWRIGAGEPVHLTTASAIQIAVPYFLALLFGTLCVAWTIRWMASTYAAHPTLDRCYALASFTATPLFLAGITHLYPILWLDFLIGLPALAYTTYLFFSGVPTMMQISKDRAFLFSCAVMAFGLVALVALLALSVLLWSSGSGLTFTSTP